MAQVAQRQSADRLQPRIQEKRDHHLVCRLKHRNRYGQAGHYRRRRRRDFLSFMNELVAEYPDQPASQVRLKGRRARTQMKRKHGSVVRSRAEPLGDQPFTDKRLFPGPPEDRLTDPTDQNSGHRQTRHKNSFVNTSFLIFDECCRRSSMANRRPALSLWRAASRRRDESGGPSRFWQTDWSL